MDPRARLWRLLPLGLLAALGGISMYLVGDPRELLRILAANGERLRTLAQDWTLASALTYTAIYAMLMTTLWVPAWLCSITGGLVFGLQLGAVCALAGATLGATAVFVLARAGLVGIVDRSGAVGRRLHDRFLAGGFSYLVAARLIPIVPFSVVNVAAATTGVSFKTYVAATALGIVPSTLIYTSVGSGLGESLEANELLHTSLVLPLVCLTALVALTFLYRVYCRRMRSKV